MRLFAWLMPQEPRGYRSLERRLIDIEGWHPLSISKEENVHINEGFIEVFSQEASESEAYERYLFSFQLAWSFRNASSLTKMLLWVWLLMSLFYPTLSGGSHSVKRCLSANGKNHNQWSLTMKKALNHPCEKPLWAGERVQYWAG